MLNSIKDLKEVNGKKVLQERIYHGDDKTIDWEATDEARETHPIFIDHDVDMISFKMLTKPASEGGNLELCQLTELISVAKHMLEYFNAKFPCEENGVTIEHLKYALQSQERRTQDRTKRGVEGKGEK